MTGRRLRIQAVVFAVVVVVSVIATGAVFAGSTVAQSNGADNAAGGSNSGNGGSDNAGDSDSGGSDNAGGSDSGGSDNAGGSDRGGSNNAGGSDNGGSDNVGGGEGVGGTPGKGSSAGGNPPAVNETGSPPNERAATGANGSGPDIAEVGRQLSQATPDVAATVEIEDTEPDRPGLTVAPGRETRTVSAVTLADEELRGTVDIKEYRDPPASVTRSIAETVLGETAANQQGGGGDTDDRTANETADSTSSEEPAVIDSVTVVSVANISVFDENGVKASDANATVQMSVNASDLSTPENTVILHETDDGWEQLDTSIAERSNETVVLAAETGGFSLFAVAEPDSTGGESATASSSNATTEASLSANESAVADDSTPGFSVWVTLTAVAGVGLFSRRLSL